MKIDLRPSQSLPPQLLPQFNQIALNTRSEFVKWNDQFALHFSNDLDWLFSKPATRNPHMSGLFRVVCLLRLLQQLENEKVKIDCVIVDCKTLHLILRSHFKALNIELILPPFKHRLRSFLIAKYQYWVQIRQYFLIKKYTWQTGKKNNIQKPIVLVDIFFQWDSSAKDHRYGNFQEFLTDEELEQIMFAPKLRNIFPHQYPKLLKEVRKRNYLFEHDYLKIKDYFYAVLHAWRRHWIRIPKIPFEHFDLTPYVKKELFDADHYAATVFAFLNYLFAKRLKQNHVPIATVVNWFENQAIDKGWNAGFQKYYPDTRIIGYRGFYGSTYETHLPSEVDVKLKLLPHTIAMIGKGSEAIIKTYTSLANTILTPAIRNSGVWQERLEIQEECYQVFIAFSGQIKSSLKAVQIWSQFIKKFPDEMNAIQVIMKVHPLFFSEETVLQAFGGKLPDQFSFVQDEIHSILERSHCAVACGRGTSAIEVLARGCPLISISDEDGLFDCPIPEAIEQDIWKACHSEEELLEAILYFKNRDLKTIALHQEKMQKIRAEYFEPVSRDGVRRLFFGEHEN